MQLACRVKQGPTRATTEPSTSPERHTPVGIPETAQPPRAYGRTRGGSEAREGGSDLVLYHGVLAARSSWRTRVVAYKRDAELATTSEPSAAQSACRRGAWADLMRRAFGYDLLAYERCGGKMVYLSCILRREVIAKILARAGPMH